MNYLTNWQMDGKILLSVLLSSVVLYVLWKIYSKNYTFTRKEKGLTLLLSFLFMVIGSVMSHGPVLMITWALFAFQFAVDLKYTDLPNGVNLAIAILSIFSIIHRGHFLEWTQNGIVTGAILFTLFLILALLGPMGGGDIKLMGAVGLYFTFYDVPSLIFYGFLVGTIHGLFMLIIRKKKLKDTFAFGPGLILGVLLAVLL